MKTFERLFTSRVSPRHWNSAVKLLSEIDATIQERYVVSELTHFVDSVPIIYLGLAPMLASSIVGFLMEQKHY